MPGAGKSLSYLLAQHIRNPEARRQRESREKQRDRERQSETERQSEA